METQIEAKFLDVEHHDFRKRLKALKASPVKSMQLMRTLIIDSPRRRLENSQNGRIILRDEGDKTIFGYEEIAEERKGGIDRLEVSTGSYDKTMELLELIGFKVHSVQEFRREVWKLGRVEIRFDERPWLKPYLEIDGPSESAIRDVAARLGFPWSQAVFGSATMLYASEYPGIRLDLRESIDQIPEMIFGKPLPSWLEERRKP